MTLPNKLKWSTDTNYAAGVESWSGTPTKVEPSTGTTNKGFIPETGLAAQNVNWVLDQLTKSNNGLVKSFATNFPHQGKGRSDGQGVPLVFGNTSTTAPVAGTMQISDLAFAPDQYFDLVRPGAWVAAYNSYHDVGGDWITGQVYSHDGNAPVTMGEGSTPAGYDNAGFWGVLEGTLESNISDTIRHYVYGYNRSRNSTCHFFFDDSRAANSKLRVIEVSTNDPIPNNDGLYFTACYDIGTRTVALGYDTVSNKQASSTVANTWTVAALPVAFSNTSNWRCASSGSLAVIFTGDEDLTDKKIGTTTNGTSYTVTTADTSFLNTGDTLCDVCWSDYHQVFIAAVHKTGSSVPAQVFTSSNGTTWNNVGSISTTVAAANSYPVSSICAHGFLLFAVTGKVGTTHRVEMAMSEDGGVTWTEVTNFPTLHKTDDIGFAITRPIVRSNGKQVAVATDVGIVASLVLTA
jgi:hypothetical protein